MFSSTQLFWTYVYEYFCTFSNIFQVEGSEPEGPRCIFAILRYKHFCTYGLLAPIHYMTFGPPAKPVQSLCETVSTCRAFWRKQEIARHSIGIHNKINVPLLFT